MPLPRRLAARAGLLLVLLAMSASTPAYGVDGYSMVIAVDDTWSMPKTDKRLMFKLAANLLVDLARPSDTITIIPFGHTIPDPATTTFPGSDKTSLKAILDDMSLKAQCNDQLKPIEAGVEQLAADAKAGRPSLVVMFSDGRLQPDAIFKPYYLDPKQPTNAKRTDQRFSYYTSHLFKSKTKANLLKKYPCAKKFDNLQDAVLPGFNYMTKTLTAPEGLLSTAGVPVEVLGLGSSISGDDDTKEFFDAVVAATKGSFTSVDEKELLFAATDIYAKLASAVVEVIDDADDWKTFQVVEGQSRLTLVVPGWSTNLRLEIVKDAPGGKTIPWPFGKSSGDAYKVEGYKESKGWGYALYQVVAPEPGTYKVKVTGSKAGHGIIVVHDIAAEATLLSTLGTYYEGDPIDLELAVVPAGHKQVTLPVSYTEHIRFDVTITRKGDDKPAFEVKDATLMTQSQRALVHAILPVEGTYTISITARHTGGLLSQHFETTITVGQRKILIKGIADSYVQGEKATVSLQPVVGEGTTGVIPKELFQRLVYRFSLTNTATGEVMVSTDKKPWKPDGLATISFTAPNAGSYVAKAELKHLDGYYVRIVEQPVTVRLPYTFDFEPIAISFDTMSEEGNLNGPAIIVPTKGSEVERPLAFDLDYSKLTSFELLQVEPSSIVIDGPTSKHAISIALKMPTGHRGEGLSITGDIILVAKSPELLAGPVEWKIPVQGEVRPWSLFRYAEEYRETLALVLLDLILLGFLVFRAIGASFPKAARLLFLERTESDAEVQQYLLGKLDNKPLIGGSAWHLIGKGGKAIRSKDAKRYCKIVARKSGFIIKPLDGAIIRFTRYGEDIEKTATFNGRWEERYEVDNFVFWLTEEVGSSMMKKRYFQSPQ